MDPTTLFLTFRFTNLSGFNWSILNDNVKTHLFFEFRFAAFPGKLLDQVLPVKVQLHLFLLVAIVSSTLRVLLDYDLPTSSLQFSD